MYGQTEATARIAYLPAHLAETAPDAVRVAIAGGALRTVADGELVYCGPNVMLGYAEHPANPSRGRDGGELLTGDLARLGDDGLLRIVGRRGLSRRAATR
jgi:long-subunit acyl-CoA synthetase (AMP-forming)